MELIRVITTVTAFNLLFSKAKKKKKAKCELGIHTIIMEIRGFRSNKKCNEERQESKLYKHHIGTKGG